MSEPLEISEKATVKFLKLIALSALCAPLLAFAVDGVAILKKLDRNLEPESYESYRKLINIEPNGNKKEFVLFSVKKGKDQTASVFLQPASDKGRSTLRQGDNMWMYLPSVGKPIRITSLQSITGGVFNNADIMRLDYAQEYDVASVDESEKTYTLHLKAKTGEVAYDKLTMTVDKKLILPVDIEAYASSGMLLKTLHFKDIKDFGAGIKRPATIETDSPLYKGYKSVMLYSGLKKRDFADEVFTQGFMPRLEELRK
ncbi:MAG: outer membrane lipoprotein-sorting protein [Rhodoferax sp.]|uniref:outer membrane lipoprotein-sorting protein n=1 Tax=Rhodoferax sp. TaxID=50421 RepID=UPI001400ACCD|nr:outer membrane lipoprotein-sorting protein [Rhodoferax sp.]NDP37901.1 outer membrane lipoprotein-sorting protein [Rhodoferax sp.]